jgi:hypothetical protein
MRLVKPTWVNKPSSSRWKRLFNLRLWTAKLILGRLYFLFLILIAAAVAMAVFDNNSPTKPVVANTDPCAFFTLKDAQSLLGKNARKGGVPPVARTSSKDTAITTCSYTQPTTSANGGPTSAPKTAAVVVGTPKTNLGKNFNDYEFNQYLPTAKMQAVAGVGDKAYWDPALGVLNVYKNHKWITISNGSIASASGRNLDDSKKLADVVVPNL